MTYWDEATIEKIRRGFYSAVYFNRTKYILEQEHDDTVVTMQVFQWNDGSVLCGVDEVIELLRVGTAKQNAIRVFALRDGDTIMSRESVMHIIGPYVYFAHLESLYLGILARRTMVATNTRRVVEAANGKPVFFFADRFDDFHNQEGDGYAAHVGGAAGACTSAHASRWNGVPVGTIPHALIAVSGGDTVKAAERFAKHIRGANVVALVDFDNDCVGTSLAVAKAIGKRLWGVRLDTASDLTDVSASFPGVNPTLVCRVRQALNEAGHANVKILVSGGFTAEKVRMFEEEHTPVDGYGVGSALVHGNNDFTADVVQVNGKNIAKAGRAYKPNRKDNLFELAITIAHIGLHYQPRTAYYRKSLQSLVYALCNSASFDTTNTIIRILAKCNHQFSDEQVTQIMKAMQTNTQIVGAFGLPELKRILFTTYDCRIDS